MDEAAMRKKLNPAQWSVMRENGTEPAYFGKYWDHAENGVYICAACSTPLFASLDKFDAHIGWPTFHAPIHTRLIEVRGGTDLSEMRCAECKSKLGYVVSGDEPYYRANSISLAFQPIELELEKEEEEEHADEKKGKTGEVAQQVEKTATSLLTTQALLMSGGGLLVGAAVAAGAFMYAAPAPTCDVPTETQSAATTTTTATFSAPPPQAPVQTTAQKATSSASAAGAPPPTQTSSATGSDTPPEEIAPQTGSDMPLDPGTGTGL